MVTHDYNHTGQYTPGRVTRSVRAESPDQPGKRLTPAAARILQVASQLFYEHGLHAVGVERIAEEAGVTKKTLYDRFGSKDALIVAYLAARGERYRAHIAEQVDQAGADPTRRLLAVFDAVGSWMDVDMPRGCAFVNALAEVPDPDHPVQQIVRAEKEWVRELFVRLATEAGATKPGQLANQLLALHEGAIVLYSAAGDRDAAQTAREAAAALVGIART